MLYSVTYRIDIDADSPLEAALKVERIFLNKDGKNVYRPILEVQKFGEEKTEMIDLSVEDNS